MNAPQAVEASAKPAAEPPVSGISRLVRRVHMFTGLFLAPWMLMYALSTLVMAHREFVGSFYSSKNPALITERELDYSRSFATNASMAVVTITLVVGVGSMTGWKAQNFFHSL